MPQKNQSKSGTGRHQRVKPRYSHTCIDYKIYRNRYYAWYYRPDLTINLCPISWVDRKMAKITLTKCFGDDVFKVLKVIKGSAAIRRGYKLGVRTFYHNGKRQIVRKFYIPPEWNKDKHSRRHFLLRIYRAQSCEKGLQKHLNMIYGK